MKRTYFFWLSLLTFVGGTINAQAVVGISVPVSHFTGNITHIALNIIKGKTHIMLFMLVALLVFAIGAFFSGYFFYDKKVKKSKAFSNYLFISAAFLSIFTFFGNISVLFFYCALYLGMQNGMLFKYKGILTRTTHITGYLTDAGVNLALAAKGKKTKLALGLFYVINILVFVAGCVFGVVSYKKLGINSLYATSSIILAAGLWYRIKIYNNQSLIGNLQ